MKIKFGVPRFFCGINWGAVEAVSIIVAYNPLF